MIITIIGSSCYREMMEEHKKLLENDGHTVFLPAFDSYPELDELGVCTYNRNIIEKADVVHLFWDQRTTGTVFDFGMVFALRKRFVIQYMQEKTLRGVMEKYEKSIQEGETVYSDLESIYGRSSNPESLKLTVFTDYSLNKSEQ